MNRAADGSIAFELDGRVVDARAGESILEAAQRHGVMIPRLCHRPGYRPDGNCRACVVEIQGERVLAASCSRSPAAGMVVRTDSERARHSQRAVIELLSSQADASSAFGGELQGWRVRLGVGASRYPARERIDIDNSHPAIRVDLNACIECGRCVRACREEQVNDVLGYAWRGARSRIVFDQGDPMGASTCVACGECVQACPTGALSARVLVAGEATAGEVMRTTVATRSGAMAAERAVASTGADERVVDSLCPYCGVGCQLRLHVRGNRILRVDGRDGPANRARLCVKGRFGFDYAMSADRLTEPLVRREGVPKQVEFTRVPPEWRDAFRAVSWDEAIARAAGGLRAIRDRSGPSALAGFGSAKGSNEEAYLFQKLVRIGFGTNNVDHCTRLCHASSVSALLEGIGSAAVSNPVSDVRHADVLLVIGANPTVNHPVAATWIKNAVRAGASLIVADPRRTELARHARHVLQFRADTDVWLLNGLLHAVIDEGLVDRVFVERRTRDYEALRATVADFSPESIAPVCGIDAATIREVARLYARGRASMILWGMGVSQHVHGTDNARCLIALSLITGQIGRPGTGLHPLRGQNNVQGASDAGLIPMMLPDYQRIDGPASVATFEALWNARLDPRPGLTVVEILRAAERGEIRGMYVMGENPAMSDPDLAHARRALASLELLVVQDIFPTETAWLADVILPASAFAEKTGSFTNTDRTIQLGRAALEPPGQALQDLAIITRMARGLGLDWGDRRPGEVFEEMRRAMPSIAGITWERLERDGAVTYPCLTTGDPGTPVVFTESFPTADGLARLVPARPVSAAELPDRAFPFVLITGRQLEHWHTGTMTRRARVLDAIEPVPTVMMHPRDMADLGVVPGQIVEVASRRGRIRLAARPDPGLAAGNIFIAFAYAEAAANLLTNPVLDPFGKIPEFKFCAVAIRVPGDDAAAVVESAVVDH